MFQNGKINHLHIDGQLHASTRDVKIIWLKQLMMHNTYIIMYINHMQLYLLNVILFNEQD